MAVTRGELERKLGSRIAAEREAAVEALGQHGDAQAFGRIIAHKGDRAACVRTRVAEVLRGYRHRGVVRTLRELLSDRDELVRLNAAESLGLIGARSAIRELICVLASDGDELVRAYAAEAIGRIADEQYVGVLARRLQREKSSAVQLRIIAAQHALGRRAMWRKILPFLDDADYHVRTAAALTLQEMCSPKRRGEIRNALIARARVEDSVAVKARLQTILSQI